MNLQAEDKSNKAMTVGSLNVLGGMKSDELTAIHTHLQAQDGVQSRIIADMEKLYQSISADGVITANEKQMLKKELIIIETEYPIILAKAEAAKKRMVDIEKYKEAFQKLYHYIYRELKVFDSMQTALEIERTAFNAVFAAYYSSRAVLQVTQDGSTKFLPSLEISGDYENQIGTFQGGLYRWINSTWKPLNTSMPANPVYYYNAAYFSTSTIYHCAPFEINDDQTHVLFDLTPYAGKEISVTATCRASNKDAPAYFSIKIIKEEEPIWNMTFDSVSNQTLHEVVKLPLTSRKLNFIAFRNDEETSCFIDVLIEVNKGVFIDSSGNNNHAMIIGSAIKTPEDKIGDSFLFCNSYLKKKPLFCMGLGKQWTHARWIKLDSQQPQNNERFYLWKYGGLDFCFFNGWHFHNNSKHLVIGSYLNIRGRSEIGHISHSKTIPFSSDEWLHLVVMTDLQENYFRRIIYLNGEKIYDKTYTDDDDRYLIQPNEAPHFDMGVENKDSFTYGALANILFFDRLLTDQEARYLYLNPQYPVKNYTLADWAVDPSNPESSIKNLTPKYLGVIETVPTTRTVVITKGERLGAQDANPGDWVLMAKTVGGWKVGVCYRWTGSMWINLEPEYNYTEQYQAALYHICEIPELMKNTGHFGALFAKQLVAQKALIDELLVNQAFIKNLVVQKLHIDSDDTTHQDFEAWFDEAHGLKINNKGEEMLRVTPDGTLLLAKKIFFNFVQHKDIGNVLYTNSVGESCKDIFNRYGSISKTAYGYLDKDFIHKITIQKVDDANVDYWCFVHLFFGRSSRGFWYKFSIPKDKYLITFFGKDKTYTYLQIRHPAYISYPPDGTKLDGFYGSLLYNNTAAEKFHSDKRIYKTSGGGYYESAVGYIGENVTPGEIFEYDKIIEEKNPPAIVLYDDDPYKITSVMKFENIPEAKPSAPNIIWKDGEFLKIS